MISIRIAHTHVGRNKNPLSDFIARGAFRARDFIGKYVGGFIISRRRRHC